MIGKVRHDINQLRLVEDREPWLYQEALECREKGVWENFEMPFFGGLELRSGPKGENMEPPCTASLIVTVRV